MILQNCCRVIPKLMLQIYYPMSTLKSLADKKKKIYENQSMEVDKIIPIDNTHKIAAQRSNKMNNALQLIKATNDLKIQKMDRLLDQFGREMVKLFDSNNSKEMKGAEILELLKSHSAKLKKQLGSLDAEQILNYVQIVKNMCFTRLSYLEHINIVYKELIIFMKLQQNQKKLSKLNERLWDSDTPLQLQIRTVCLVQFMTEKDKQKYFKRICPFIHYFKSTQIMIMIYQKWKYNHKYNYQLLSQIHNNQFFISMDDINQNYIKMLFIATIQGQFCPSDDGIFSKVLNSFQQKPNVLVYETFFKFVKILHSQSFYVQTQNCRANLQFSLNNFINIAKNQNYNQSSIDMDQLIQIYLGFEQSSSTGQILLNQIVYLSKSINYSITTDNYPKLKKLLNSVLKNVEKRLKYERKDYLNKVYTNDTIAFLRQFLPKFMKIQPMVVLQVNDVAHQLSIELEKADEFTTQFDKSVNLIIKKYQQNKRKPDMQLTLKLLKFLLAFKVRSSKYTNISSMCEYLLIRLNDFRKYVLILDGSFQMLNVVLSLSVPSFGGKNMIQNFYIGNIQREMENQINQNKNTEGIIVNSFDQTIIWLSLCIFKISQLQINVRRDLIYRYFNERLYYMINSLKYDQVYQVLALSIKINYKNPLFYQKLLQNLSTFVIYIDERKSRTNTSSFFFNHIYKQIYPKICSLILQHTQFFLQIQNKNCFRVFQVMINMFYDISNQKTMTVLLKLIGDPSFLNTSIVKKLELVSFSKATLQASNFLHSFEYYNKLILQFFSGKSKMYSQLAIYTKENLTKLEIQESFSQIQIYKTILMDGELQLNFQIPPPKTEIVDYKYMYVCQKVYQKLIMQNKFDFEEGYAPSKIKFSEVNLNQQKKYIEEQLLIPYTEYNQLRIKTRNLPIKLKLEVWKTNSFIDPELSFDPKDIFFNTKKLADQILSKIIKGICGSLQKVKEAIKEFNGNEQLLNFIKDSSLNYVRHGASIEILDKDGNILLTLLNASKNNYKVIFICAYLMMLNGHNVVIIKEHQIPHVIEFLNTYYFASQPKAKEQTKINVENDNVEATQ